MSRVKLIGLGFAVLSVLVSGCGRPSTPRPPPEIGGQLTWQPDDKVVFAFENRAKGFSQPTWNKDVPVAERVPLVSPSLWSSTMSGEFHYVYGRPAKPIPEAEEPEHLTFTYNLRNWRYTESGADGTHTWSEVYGQGLGKNGDVEIEVDGRKMENPLRAMIGEPRELFIDPDSLALFSFSGEPLRLKRDLYLCQPPGCWRYFENTGPRAPAVCPRCGHAGILERKRQRGQLAAAARYRTDSFSVGQYFFEGINVEELAHRIGVAAPPATVLKGGTKPVTWTTRIVPWVVPEGAEEGWAPEMACELLEETKFQGHPAWRLRFTLTLRSEKARVLASGDIFQGFEWTSRGEALVEPASRMPWSVAVEDESLWYDVLPFPRSTKEGQYQVVSRRYQNHYEAHRVL